MTTEPKLSKLIKRLQNGLVGRDTEIRLAILALLAGEHVLLIGPPGTAKSEVAHRLLLVLGLNSEAYFQRLLTRFTVPEEVFGPLSLKALKEDRYVRQTTGYLPEASIAFIDEIFKANSAILNALLTLLNERKFDNGSRRVDTNLISVIAASNELPAGPELGALLDRFLLRLIVNQVSKKEFRELLRQGDLTGPEIDDDLCLTVEELKELRENAGSVHLPDEVKEHLKRLRDTSVRNKIAVSDRRWVKLAHLLRMSACTNGRKEVTFQDCALAQYCLGRNAEEQKIFRDEHVTAHRERLLQTAGEGVKKVLNGMDSTLEKLHSDLDKLAQAEIQRRNSDGRPLFKGPDGQETTDDHYSVRATKRVDGKEVPLFRDPLLATGAPQGGLTEKDLFDQLHMRGWTLRTVFEYCETPESHLLRQFQNPEIMEPKRYTEGELEEESESIRQLDALHEEATRLHAEMCRSPDHLWVSSELHEDAVAHERKSIDGRLEELRQILENARQRHKKLMHA